MTSFSSYDVIDSNYDVKFRYSFTNRGEIFVKGKGMVETFLLERETDLWKNKKVLTELVHILHFRTFFSGLD